jgi:hypothetical protein
MPTIEALFKPPGGGREFGMEGPCVWKELASDRNQIGKYEAWGQRVLNPRQSTVSRPNRKTNPKQRPHCATRVLQCRLRRQKWYLKRIPPGKSILFVGFER